MTARILCIEDEPDLRSDLVLELRDAGYEVREAGDGLAGLEIALNEAIDVVLCDINLPGLGGLEVVGRLRDHPGKAASPAVIFLTAFADGNMQDMIRNANPAGILIKPIDYDEMLNAVAGVLRSAAPAA